MGILIDREQQVYHLQTQNTSYIIGVIQDKYLGHIYWGNKIRTPDGKRCLLRRWSCFDVIEPDKSEGAFSLDYICREYPSGEADYRAPAFMLEFEDGSRQTEFVFESVEVLKKKPKLSGLPSLLAEEGETETLRISLVDKLSQVYLHLYYCIYPDYDVISRHVVVENQGEQKVKIHRLMSGALDFDRDDLELLTLPGAWGRERQMERGPVRKGQMTLTSRRGASSHQMNPFMALLEPGASENQGEVYGLNLVYSGNFTGIVEGDQRGKTRVMLGFGNEDFSWCLEPEKTLTSPELVMVHSKEGLGGMSRIYHNIYRDRLVRGTYKKKERPVLVNNWEATYFDFDQEKILDLADRAADLGLELLVLDDGWFGKRNDDKTSLGDWFVNEEKLPGGITGLAQKVGEKGLGFGLWFEPESISRESRLYKRHPDWCIHVKDRYQTECRNQLLLDLSREDVCDYIIGVLDQILTEAPISYVKWDMNSHMSNLGSAQLEADRQRELPHRYMLGLYRVLEEVTGRHEDVLFESCSGGGGRFDPGMLYYMPQVWTSDDTDPIERVYIQYGTSLVYPPSTMGAHVSAVPNHQSGRVTPLETRGNVAMSGLLGYELDLGKFSQEEEEKVKEQIQFYKENRKLIMEGDLYRIKNPFESSYGAWMICSRDKKEVLVTAVCMRGEVNGKTCRLKLVGLDPDLDYKDMENGEIYQGDELIEIGLLADLYGDYESKVWKFQGMY
ncbi:MAG: alpha-galactosidase [Eubacterium sp.]|nr:alpha-galactosidase [Eubacterium sp.]